MCVCVCVGVGVRECVLVKRVLNDCLNLRFVHTQLNLVGAVLVTPLFSKSAVVELFASKELLKGYLLFHILLMIDV